MVEYMKSGYGESGLTLHLYSWLA